MADHFSPQRRLLLEGTKFFYAIGNTQLTSYFTNTRQANSKVLFLGFGDLRNALATARDCAVRADAQCQSLELHLNDISLLNVARGVLLAHLADAIDPRNPDDVAFLWGVWYCHKLPAAWRQRLGREVQRLCQEEGLLSVRVPRRQDAQQVLRVLQRWSSSEGWPTLRQLEAQRAQHVRSWWGRKLKSDLSSEGPAFREALQGHATMIASGALPFYAKGNDRKRACLAVLGEMLRGWQACRAQRKLTTQFFCGDALQLCQYDLEAHAYCSVDTSNLADHVGLLNLLACVPRVLLQSPFARLYTGSMLWPTAARSLGGYLEAAIGVDPRLYPTLFGLRLINDPQQLGRELPYPSMVTHLGMADVSDVLEWMPCSMPSLLPQLELGEPSSSADLAAALKTLCSKCCPSTSTGQPGPKDERCGIQLPSALTLLCLLGGLAERAEGVLPLATDRSEGTPAWQRLADHTAALCVVPPRYRIQWDALCCWACYACCAGGGGAGAGAESAPWMATAELELSPAFQAICDMGGTPLLWAELFHVPLQDLASAMAAVSQDPRKFSHPLNVFSYDYTTHRLRLLLPPESAKRPLAHMTVRVSDGEVGTPLTSFPLPLLAFKRQPCTAPAPPGLLKLGAAVSNCPPPHLLAARAQAFGGSAGSSAAHAASSSTGNSTGADRCSSTGSSTGSSGALRGASSAAKLSGGVQLRGVHELAASWQLVLGFDPGLGALSSAGLRVEFSGVPEVGGSTHVVKLEVASTRSSVELHFSWPVDSQDYHVKVFKGRRELQLVLRKSRLWPLDSAWLPRVHPQDLATFDASREGPLAIHMSCMYSPPENMERQRGSGVPGRTGNPLFDVKESIQCLFVNHAVKGARMHLFHGGPYSERMQEPAITLASHALLELPDSRPLLLVSYVDHSMAQRVLTAPDQLKRGFDRFGKVLRHANPSGANSATVSCTPLEIEMVLTMLARNAARLKVPKWQRQLLELPSEWRASFVVPLYSDYISERSEADSFISMTKRTTASSSARDTSSSGGIGASASASSGTSRRGTSTSSGSGSGGSHSRDKAARVKPATEQKAPGGVERAEEAGSAAGQALRTARQHKERGNALFKQGQYREAAQQYQAGAEACGVVLQGQGGSGHSVQSGHGMALAVDCCNNIAQAMLRLAEEAGPDAEVALQQAKQACDAVLQLDPDNTKALYRRAKARYLLGKPHLAHGDLERVAGVGDAAVETLREQIAAALQL